MTKTFPVNKADLTITINPARENSDDDSTSVDASAVGKLLQALPELISEFHTKNAENEKLLVKARPFAKGSFEIPLELVLIGAGTLLMSRQEIFKKVIDRIKQFISIKQQSKGEPIHIHGENVVIIKNSTVTLDSVVFNIIKSPNQAEEKFREAINELRQDSTIHSLDIREGTEKRIIASIPSTQFDYFATQIKVVDKVTQERESISTKRKRLEIKEADFAGTAKWRFYDEAGAILEAKIEDKMFIAQVKSGERFGAKDALEVDMEIREIFDHFTEQLMKKSYVIKNVLRVHKSNLPKSLFDVGKK